MANDEEPRRFQRRAYRNECTLTQRTKSAQEHRKRLAERRKLKRFAEPVDITPPVFADIAREINAGVSTPDTRDAD